MPRIIDDDDENEGEDSPASLRAFIVPDDDKDGPAPSVVTPRPLEDVIGFIEHKLAGSKGRGLEDLMKAAEESYKKLAHDCLVLAYQSEADWKPGFRKLLRKSIGARIKADANKDSVRDEDVCAACGRDEERSNMRLDLFGSYELRNFCQPADLDQKWADFSKESTTPTDYGSFYLGNECLRKFQTSFLLRTHMSDLVGAVARRIKEWRLDGMIRSVDIDGSPRLMTQDGRPTLANTSDKSVSALVNVIVAGPARARVVEGIGYDKKFTYAPQNQKLSHRANVFDQLVLVLVKQEKKGKRHYKIVRSTRSYKTVTTPPPRDGAMGDGVIVRDGVGEASLSFDGVDEADVANIVGYWRLGRCVEEPSKTDRACGIIFTGGFVLCFKDDSVPGGFKEEEL